MHPAGQGLGATQPVRILLEELQVAVAQHGRTRAGRNDDVAGRLFENPDGMFGQGAGLGAQPGIESRLPATGLRGWEFDPHAGAVKNVHDRLANIWKE